MRGCRRTSTPREGCYKIIASQAGAAGALLAGLFHVYRNFYRNRHTI